jgi:glutathione S-transferase
MEDHSVGPLLRELPREQAREGFTARVMARLDAPSEPKPWLQQPRLVLATAALAAVVASAGILQVHAGRQQELRTAEARKVLRELRSEHDSLKQELQSLSQPPVVYLGGDDEVDLVVDLSRVQSARF